MGSRGDLWGCAFAGRRIGIWVRHGLPAGITSVFLSRRLSGSGGGNGRGALHIHQRYGVCRRAGRWGRYPLSGCTDPGKTAVLVDSPAL
ncbi:MAG: hypothetical protein ACLRRG_12500 [Barnesiella sp.]